MVEAAAVVVVVEAEIVIIVIVVMIDHVIEETEVKVEVRSVAQGVLHLEDRHQVVKINQKQVGM